MDSRAGAAGHGFESFCGQDFFLFCNFRLFRAAGSSTGPIQMKSGMTFIRGNGCIERVKDNFLNGDVVHR